MASFPTTGQTISFSDINVKHGRSPTATISLGETEIRKTARRTTANTSVGIGDHLAGTARCVIVLSANENGVNLKTKCDADGYVAGSTYVTCTINSGVVIGGTPANFSAALHVAGFSDNDVIEIINNGDIIGFGGNGGYSGGGAGTYGGTGMNLFNNCTVVNNGRIAGGGGGGAGGLTSSGSSKIGGSWSSIGGGGGGGAGVPAGIGSFLSNASTQATDGSKLTGGTGGVGYGVNSGAGGNGGNGGALASAGGSTGSTSFTFGPIQIGSIYSGGSPGYAIRQQGTGALASINSTIGIINGGQGVF